MNESDESDAYTVLLKRSRWTQFMPKDNDTKAKANTV